MRVKKSIQTKFIASILAVSIVPALVLFLLTLNNNSSFYKQQITAASEMTIEKQSMTINNIFRNMEEVLDTMLYSQYMVDNDIQTISKSELNEVPVSSYQRLLNSRKISSLGESVAYNNDYIESLYLYIPGKYVYSYNKSYRTEIGIEDFARLDQGFVSSGSPYFSVQVIHPNKLYPEDKYVIVSKNVSDPRYGNVLGMLSIILNTSMFESVKSSSLPWDNVCILDNDGTVLFGDSSISLSEDEMRQIGGSSIGHISRGRSQGMLLYSTLNIDGWKIVSQVSMESFNSSFWKNIYYLIAVTALCIVGVLFMSFVLSRIFTRPVIRLSKMMQETIPSFASIGPRYIEREDEIGILYRRFGAMVDKINALIQDKYLNEIALLKSKMKNLIAQINSHFVFNTLENINCLAEIEEIESISVMSKSLGDMLRYSIDYEEDVVPLESEIRQIVKYNSIQEIRFGKKINLAVEAGDSFLGHNVLKFMLQPIVENAIEHGLHSREGEWRLDISAKEHESKLRVTVHDNGTGMDSSKLEEIRAYLKTGEKQEKTDGRHHEVGLINIDRRIKLLCGDEFGLSLESDPGTGTSVHVDLPL